MSSSEDQVQAFLQLAERIASATGVARLRVGAVAVLWEGAWNLLVLKAEAVTGPPEEPRRFETDLVRAVEVVAPFEALNDLVGQLDHARLTHLGELPLFADPLLLPAAEGLARWELHPQQYDRGLRVAELRYLAPRMPYQERGGVLDRFDADVARASEFQYASLARLVRDFAGPQFRDDPSAYGVALQVRWPLSHVDAVVGDHLEVTLAGMPGLDPGRIRLNLESEEGDRRLDDVHWIVEPRQDEEFQDLAVYRGEALIPERRPTGLNAYFAGLPEHRLHTEVSRPQAPIFLSNDELLQRRGRERAVPLAGEESTLRVTKFHVEGYRLLRDVHLEFGDLTVLVGPNQAGKSTLLRALDFVAEGARGTLANRISEEGGFDGLVSRVRDLREVTFVIHLKSATLEELEYGFVLERRGHVDVIVANEWLGEVDGEGLRTVYRSKNGIALMAGGRQIESADPRELLLFQLGATGSADVLRDVRAALAGIRSHDLRTAEIEPQAQVRPGARLNRSGSNLVAALYVLAQTPGWTEYLELVRLAFPELKEIRFSPAAHGEVRLLWREQSGVEFDVQELSDGALGYLAALCALSTPGASIVTIDEPERHLHPDAIYRLLAAAQISGGRQPVVLATQSDRLIGFLDETPEAIAVVQRRDLSAQIIRPQPDELRKWMVDFRLDEVRNELEHWGAGE